MSRHLFNNTWSFWSAKGKEGKTIDPPFDQLSKKNVRCGDAVFFDIFVESKSLKSIGYHSKGCSICLATSAFLAEYLLNKSLDEAIKSLHQIERIVNGNADEVADQAFDFFKLLHQYPTRKECVLINTKTLLKFLNDTLTNR